MNTLEKQSSVTCGASKKQFPISNTSLGLVLFSGALMLVVENANATFTPTSFTDTLNYGQAVWTWDGQINNSTSTLIGTSWNFTVTDLLFNNSPQSGGMYFSISGNSTSETLGFNSTVSIASVFGTAWGSGPGVGLDPASADGYDNYYFSYNFGWGSTVNEVSITGTRIVAVPEPSTFGFYTTSLVAFGLTRFLRFGRCLSLLTS